MCYVNAWLKSCLFKLDLNWENIIWTPHIFRKDFPEFRSQMQKKKKKLSFFYFKILSVQ